jgi:cytosine deaminase
MSEFILESARTLNNRVVDIIIRDGTIVGIKSAGEGDGSAFDDDQRLDANGRLVTPTLVEPHTHLDDTLLAGNPYWNETGTLEEGWKKTNAQRDGMPVEEYKQRAETLLKWFLANGITRVRSHVNTGPEGLEAVEALIDLRQKYKELIDIQLVAFPSASLYDGDESKLDRFEEAIDMGLDIVGGIPHKEHTHEKAVKHVKTIVDLADRHDLPLDPHIDETDDPGSRCTGVLASEALERGIGDRTTASHVTALHSYPNAYADKLIRLLAESGVSVVTNPLSNAVLQGRYDDYPRRRGHTRIDELRDAGVTVGIGQDDVVDLFHSYGDGDPLKTAFVLVHLAHMNGQDDVGTLWQMLTEANAEIFGLDPDEYGLSEGNEGSLIVFDGYSPFDVLRTQSPRTLVLKDGRPVARTERKTTIEWKDDTLNVDFNRPSARQ